MRFTVSSPNYTKRHVWKTTYINADKIENDYFEEFITISSNFVFVNSLVITFINCQS